MFFFIHIILHRSQDSHVSNDEIHGEIHGEIFIKTGPTPTSALGDVCGKPAIRAGFHGKQPYGP
jgi:hypothetical protein